MSFAIAWIVAAVGLASALGCSVVVEPDREQCQTDADCQRLGSAFQGAVCRESVCQADPAWSCVGHVEWPEPVSETATVTVNFADLITKQPVAGVVGKFCLKFDPTCTVGAVAGATDLTSNAEGAFQAQIPIPFDGFVSFESPDGKMPGSYFFYPPITANRFVPPIPLLKPEVLGLLATQAGKPIDPEDGHVLLAAYNCEPKLTRGVHLSADKADADTSPFYVIQSVPTTTASETDDSGWGGLVNLNPGAVQVMGTIAAQDKHMGTASVTIHSGRVTYTALVPTP